MKTTTQHTAFKTFIVFAALVLSTFTAAASPQITDVSHSPGLISAGDEVNISVMLNDPDIINDDFEIEDKVDSELKPGSYRTEEYISVIDKEGEFSSKDSSSSYLYPDGNWNERYTIDVAQDAPTGNYQFVLETTYIDDERNTTTEFRNEFTVHVDREGPSLTANVVKTDPTTPRPGDDYVKQEIRVTNTGGKPVEEVIMRPVTPEGVEKAYSSDEKFMISRLDPGSSKTFNLGLDLSEDLEPGLYTVGLETDYEDVEANSYSESLEASLRVEGRPDLELVNASVDMKAGETADLRVQVRNTGSQDAESVTTRVIAERSQPFSLNDRSNYVGEVEAGESSEAVMSVSADRAASLKTHQVKIQLRATGDSEQGDSSVYTFTEESKITLDGRTESNLIYAGIALAALVLVAAVYRFVSGKGSKSESDDSEEDIK